MKHIPYPEIGQFRNAIHKVTCKARQTGVDANGDAVYDHAKELPVLTYEGTVKLHGTNAAIGLNRKTNEVWYQSRENVITVGKDNAGFCRYFEGKDLTKLFEPDPSLGVEVSPIALGTVVVIFGEWCGGNIQPNVGIAKLSKRFVIFGILVDEKWLGRESVSKIKDESLGVYNIHDYQSETITIDFNKPEIAQNKLSELTIKVEESCPVAKAMGVSGIGEGIVWKCITPGWESPEFYFKVKGNLHAQSKVTTLKPVDLEKLDKVSQLAAMVTPEWRLAQMLDKACDLMNGGMLDMKRIGNFIKLVTDDVAKEESDVVKKSGFELKDINGHIAKISKNYFFERMKNIGY